MSIDCKYNKLGECDIRNSYKITKDGVLQNVLECEICGRRETELFTDKYPDSHKYYKVKKSNAR